MPYGREEHHGRLDQGRGKQNASMMQMWTNGTQEVSESGPDFKFFI